MNEKEISYWDFIAKYLPNYDTRDDVLQSDILVRFLNNEQVEENDIIAILENCDFKEAWKAHLELDKSLMTEAIDAYFQQQYGSM